VLDISCDRTDLTAVIYDTVNKTKWPQVGLLVRYQLAQFQKNYHTPMSSLQNINSKLSDSLYSLTVHKGDAVTRLFCVLVGSK
jgi:hypothetical protein